MMEEQHVARFGEEFRARPRILNRRGELFDRMKTLRHTLPIAQRRSGKINKGPTARLYRSKKNKGADRPVIRHQRGIGIVNMRHRPAPLHAGLVRPLQILPAVLIFKGTLHPKKLGDHLMHLRGRASRRRIKIGVGTLGRQYYNRSIQNLRRHHISHHHIPLHQEMLMVLQVKNGFIGYLHKIQYSQ